MDVVSTLDAIFKCGSNLCHLTLSCALPKLLWTLSAVKQVRKNKWNATLTQGFLQGEPASFLHFCNLSTETFVSVGPVFCRLPGEVGIHYGAVLGSSLLVRSPRLRIQLVAIWPRQCWLLPSEDFAWQRETWSVSKNTAMLNCITPYWKQHPVFWIIKV